MIPLRALLCPLLNIITISILLAMLAGTLKPD